MRLSLKNYQGVIFDFDGTLVPCLDLRAMKKRLLDFTTEKTGIGLSLIEPLMMVEFIDFTVKWMRHRGLNGDEFYLQAHQMIRDIELESAHLTGLFPGTQELLTALKRSGKKIGIVTRNCAQAVRIMYPEIDQTCDALVDRDRADFLKPDPRHLQQCLEELSLSPSQAVMVGDGVVDIQLAQALNMHAIAVLGGHNNAVELAKSAPNWQLDHVNELLRYL